MNDSERRDHPAHSGRPEIPRDDIRFWRHLDPDVLKRPEFLELVRRVEALERRLGLRGGSDDAAGPDLMDRRPDPAADGRVTDASNAN